MANTVTTRQTAAQKKAAKLEAEGAAVDFEYLGESYTVPPFKKWDLDAMEAYEDGKILSCIRAVLGPDQWKVFKAGKPNMGDFDDFCGALFEATGTTVGESEG